MKLIDKDAVLAEIDKRIKVLQKHPMENHKTICHLDSVKQSINSLEVKEVDINKEISQFIDANFEKATIGHKLSLRRVAKHFFELGLHHSITKECVNEICQLFMEREAIEKFFPDSIDWVYKQLQKGENI